MEDKRVRRTKKLLRQALAELMREKEFLRTLRFPT